MDIRRLQAVIRLPVLKLITSEGRIICIYEATVFDVDNEYTEVKEGYEQLCVLIKKVLKLAITIGLGTAHEGYSGIRESYIEATRSFLSFFVWAIRKACSIR